MKFIVALSYLITNVGIRRSNWSDRMWLSYDGKNVSLKCLDKNNKETCIHKFCENEKVFSMEDLVAEDWKVYFDPHTGTDQDGGVVGKKGDLGFTDKELEDMIIDVANGL